MRNPKIATVYSIDVGGAEVMGDGGKGTDVASVERFGTATGGDFVTGAIGCTGDDGRGTSDLTRSAGCVVLCPAFAFLRLSEEAALAAPERLEETLFRLNFCASILA